MDAPWYILNNNLYHDSDVEPVDKVIIKYAEAHKHRLHHHVNTEAIKLLGNTNKVRQLQGTKTS